MCFEKLDMIIVVKFWKKNDYPNSEKGLFLYVREYYFKTGGDPKETPVKQMFNFN